MLSTPAFVDDHVAFDATFKPAEGPVVVIVTAQSTV
jgi:hypothetical protein